MLQHIFDTHAHYDDERFDEDREQVIRSLPEKGVAAVMNIGCSIDSSRQSIAMAEAIPFFYAAVGVHPQEAAAVEDGYLSILRELAAHEKVKAIGEIGLDYYYEAETKERQKKIFIEQIELAKELDLPAIIHDRDAHGDTMDILRTHRPKGIVHCYSGSAEMAKELVDLGMYIGFTGALTFKNARKAVESVEAIPLDRLLLETDCPYMAPEPMRGHRSDSSLIAYTAQKMAQIKGLDPQEMIDIAAENARRVYDIH